MPAKDAGARTDPVQQVTDPETCNAEVGQPKGAAGTWGMHHAAGDVRAPVHLQVGVCPPEGHHHCTRIAADGPHTIDGIPAGAGVQALDCLIAMPLHAPPDDNTDASARHGLMNHAC